MESIMDSYNGLHEINSEKMGNKAKKDYKGYCITISTFNYDFSHNIATPIRSSTFEEAKSTLYFTIKRMIESSPYGSERKALIEQVNEKIKTLSNNESLSIRPCNGMYYHITAIIYSAALIYIKSKLNQRYEYATVDEYRSKIGICRTLATLGQWPEFAEFGEITTPILPYPQLRLPGAYEAIIGYSAVQGMNSTNLKRAYYIKKKTPIQLTHADQFDQVWVTEDDPGSPNAKYIRII